MTYEQANKAMPYATRNVEVLERLGWECKQCNATGYVGVTAKGCGAIKCPICRGKGVLKYSWTPQVGEWCMNNKFLKGSPLIITKGNCPDPKYYTPILEWEEIERVLKKVGYKLKIRETSQGEYFALIKGQTEVGGIGKSRQQAVMRAVIELGKELENDNTRSI